MPLTIGTRFGPYEIVAPLGSGGMGEVYRARDTRLGRDVAIKVLPEHLAATPEVRARFEREAKAVSSLNHPNICTLYDVGRAPGEAGSDGVDYLVMELIEGETLAHRLEKGPLPIGEILRCGIEIADALDRAHRSGLIHRDLKPGNVMLTRSGAKVLDFGLARVTGLSSTTSDLSTSPTTTRALTAEGSIVGTFQYMAPEVLEGKDADARSDLWALGAILYEAATGRRAFEGRSQASLIGAIMNTEPVPVSQVAPMTPPAFERIVRTCLAKDPDQRIQTAHDVKLQLQWLAEGGSQAGVPAPVAARRRGREQLAWLVAGALSVFAVALGVMLWRSAGSSTRVMRFDVPLLKSLTPSGPLRIAPDGTAAAFSGSDSTGVARLWLRSFDDLECRPLPGTEGAGRPFWSPDSRHLGFFAEGKLKKILVSGGRPETVCEAPGGADGCWGRGDVILFDGDAAHQDIRMVSAGGGLARAVTTRDTTKHEGSCDWPEMLPDGRHFLYVSENSEPDRAAIRIGDLRSKKVITVMPGSSRVEYVSPGFLLFEREGTLMEQALDAGTGKLKGEPHTLVDRIGVNRGNGMPYFSASTNGVLVYSKANSSLRRLVWMDRAGRALEEIGSPSAVGNIALSPDGRLLALELSDASGQASDLWVRDLARGITSRLTVDPGNDIWPVWSPDSRRLYWTSNRAGTYAVYEREVEGVGGDSLLYAGSNNTGTTDASIDGRFVACMRTDAGGAWDALAVPAHGKAEPVPIAVSKFSEARPRFSPDGRWVAYDSDQSGRIEVYIQAFPGPGRPVQISNQGGADPRWRSDGKELFYRSPEMNLMAVDVKTGDRLEAGLPRMLFNTPLLAQGMQVARYVPSADGQKFLFCAPMRAELASPTIVFNWTAALKQK